MSPLALRRFRAERLLRTEFEQLRVKVLAAVQSRLAARGVSIARADLDASYAMAWHGLYSAAVSGKPIDKPEAWLTLVTFRRALDEHRARARLGRLEPLGPAAGGDEPPGAADAPSAGRATGADHFGARDPDLAGALDDRARLAAFFEGIREALSAREREAAALCYLQGMSRAEAAERMGIGEKRMRKLMDGRGDGRPGVAAKIGTLAMTIERGEWCEQRGSLMRALAFGILVPGGERHRLALAHHRNCPACRSYVASLRGIAALLPPWALPPSLLGALVGGAGGAGSAGAGPAAAGAAGTGTAGAGAAGAGVAGAGAGAAGAGGGWALAGGPLGAKLAVGCLLLVGTGCATLGVFPGGGQKGGHGDPRQAARARGSVAGRVASTLVAGEAARSAPQAGGAAGSSRAAPPGPDGTAIREFGIEGGAPASRSQRGGRRARAASASSAGSVSVPQSAPVASTASAASSGSAAREFSPG